jgi:hypothetical protein
MKKASLTILFLAVLVTVCLCLSPAMRIKCRQASGVVTAIYKDGTRDAVFRLEGHEPLFYINRAFEKDPGLDRLLENLKGRQVEIRYADNHTPLGNITECRHISELSADGEILYSEFHP